MATRIRLLFHLALTALFCRLAAHLLGSALPTLAAKIPIVRQSMPQMLVLTATSWILHFHWLYFGCCVVVDLLSATQSSEHVRNKLKDFTSIIFASIVWPITIVVSVNFWVFFTVDRRLLDPYGAIYEDFDPQTNHMMHTYTVPIAFIELCIRQSTAFPESLAKSVQSQAKVLGFYFLIILVVQPFTPMWTYPFFQKMGPAHWVLFFVANLVLAVATQVAGKVLSDRLLTSTSCRQRSALDNCKKTL